MKKTAIFLTFLLIIPICIGMIMPIEAEAMILGGGGGLPPTDTSPPPEEGEGEGEEGETPTNPPEEDDEEPDDGEPIIIDFFLVDAYDHHYFVSDEPDRYIASLEKNGTVQGYSTASKSYVSVNAEKTWLDEFDPATVGTYRIEFKFQDDPDGKFVIDESLRTAIVNVHVHDLLIDNSAFGGGGFDDSNVDYDRGAILFLHIWGRDETQPLNLYYHKQEKGEIPNTYNWQDASVLKPDTTYEGVDFIFYKENFEYGYDYHFIAEQDGRTSNPYFQKLTIPKPDDEEELEENDLGGDRDGGDSGSDNSGDPEPISEEKKEELKEQGDIFKQEIGSFIQESADNFDAHMMQLLSERIQENNLTSATQNAEKPAINLENPELITPVTPETEPPEEEEVVLASPTTPLGTLVTGNSANQETLNKTNETTHSTASSNTLSSNAQKTEDKAEEEATIVEVSEIVEEPESIEQPTAEKPEASVIQAVPIEQPVIMETAELVIENSDADMGDFALPLAAGGGVVFTLGFWLIIRARKGKQ